MGTRLDRALLAPSYRRDFRNRSLGGLKTRYWFGDQAGPTSRTIPGQLQVYVDRAYGGGDPFLFDGKALVIQADRNRQPRHPKLGDAPYTSGLISTEGAFEQRYGYFEMRAALPAGKGLWPAFWLLARHDPGRIFGPQHLDEIDVMENIGDPGTIYCSAHWNENRGRKTIPVKLATTTATHSYGVLWTPALLAWFVDDALAAQTPNPGLHRPMYLLANLGVGGDWPGAPDGATRFPARMTIEHLAAYRIRG
jgi:beta-glucanase (GH16 family)